MEKRSKAVKVALVLLKDGISVIPLKPKSKLPALKGWRTRRITSKKDLLSYAKQNPAANYGVPTGFGIDVIDVDGKVGASSLKKLQSKYGKLPPTVTVITPGGGLHLYYCNPKTPLRNSVGALGKRIDVRGAGGFVVAPGSRHPNGGLYKFAKGKGPADVKTAKLPGWVRKKLMAAAPPAVPVETSKLSDADLARWKPYAERALEKEARRVSNAPVSQRNDTLNRAAFRMGQFLPSGALTSEKIRSSLTSAAQACGLAGAEIIATLDSGTSKGQLSPRRLPSALKPDEGPDDEKGKARHLTARLAKLGETDTDNAERFVRRYAGRVLWTPGLGWLVYDRRRWLVDNLNRRLKFAQTAMKAIEKEVRYLGSRGEKTNREDFAKLSLGKAAIDRLLQLAQPDLAVDDSKLDRDPYLLNCLNGTVDLRTGQLEKHESADLITCLSPFKFKPKARCKRFKEFLRQASGGNKDMARFLQKAVGYTLTGDVSEQVLFFAHGPTQTGKSTFVNLIRDLLGDYGIHTPTKTLLVKQYDNEIPVDIARMKGARMVTAIENNPNQQLDEAKVKAMTGGDKQTARFMRQNLFEFTPEFKLWIAINDLPRVRATDDAIWRRFIVLPFKTQVDETRDLKLPCKLREEAPGILAWAVRGTLLWSKEGLQDRSLFDLEKNRWRDQSDTVGRFFQECCQIVDPAEFVQSSVILARYKQWCIAKNEQPSSDAIFHARMIELDVAPKRKNSARGWSGIKLTN